MKKLVIIGGGFAGANIAKALESSFNVTLIDNKDFFEFTPGILRTIVAPKHIKKIQLLHSHYLSKTNIIHGEVEKITEKYILLNNKKIPYDYLTICSGSIYGVPIKEKNVVISARANTLRKHYNQLCKAKKVLIIGGGIVGVELAAEIIQNYQEKKVILVQSRGELMPRNNQKTKEYANNYLTKKGVQLIFNERVVKAKGNTYTTKTKKKIKADMAFICTGINPHSQFMQGKFKKDLDNRRFIKVNSHLQLESHPHIFAVGDVTGIKEEKTAQNAEEQAKIAIHNIKALENDTKKANYNTEQRWIIVSLGKYKGIMTKGEKTYTGLIPAVAKYFVERLVMLKLNHF